MFKKLYKGYVFIILSAVIFGCMPLMSKRYIYPDGVNPASLVFLRNAIALVPLAIFAYLENKSLKIQKRALPSLCLIALMGCCVTPVLLFSSYKFIPSGTATVFHFIYPAVVVVGGMLFLKKKVRPMALISVGMCVLGICLFYDPSVPLDMTGAAVAMASGVTFAIYVIMISVFKYQIKGFLFTFYVALISSVAMLGYCLATNSLSIPKSAVGWCACVVFSMSVTVGAVYLFQKGTLIIGGERASILSTVEPITGVVIGICVFQETVSPLTVIGSVIVILASILIAISDIKRSS